jgi:hypothetical protein
MLNCSLPSPSRDLLDCGQDVVSLARRKVKKEMAVVHFWHAGWQRGIYEFLQSVLMFLVRYFTSMK